MRTLVELTTLAPKRYVDDNWANKTPSDRRDSSRAAALLRSLERDLSIASLDNSGSSSSTRRISNSSNGSSTGNIGKFGDLGRTSLNGVGRSSSLSSPGSLHAQRDSLQSLDRKNDSGELWNDVSLSLSSSMPSRRDPKKLPAPGRSEDEFEDHSARSSSRLSNSAGCSSSGNAYMRPQEQRVTRSNSLSRSSDVRRQVCVAGLVGLMNEGNTCFLNSCLQCLGHTAPLASAILGPFADSIQARGSSVSRTRRDSASLSEMLAYAFKQLLKDLCGKPAYSTASASLLLQSLQALSPQFAGNRQHDAQEAMRTIIDGLHEALNRKPPGRPKCPEPPPTTPEADIANICWEHHRTWNNSVIQDIFCGQLQSTIECSVCQRKSHCFDPFLDLSLPLPKSGYTSDSLRSFSTRSRVTIEDCLSTFVAPETLDSSNKYYCSGCKAPQISTKKLSIYRAPPVLVLHVKRFYGVEPRSYRKDDRPISYPLNGLDLSSFMSLTARRALMQQPTYDLYGVCSHFGSLGYGHYTATCKTVDNGWYCYNDSSVSSVQDPIDSSAYILFYQQRA